MLLKVSSTEALGPTRRTLTSIKASTLLYHLSRGLYWMQEGEWATSGRHRAEKPMSISNRSDSQVDSIRALMNMEVGMECKELRPATAGGKRSRRGTSSPIKTPAQAVLNICEIRETHEKTSMTNFTAFNRPQSATMLPIRINRLRRSSSSREPRRWTLPSTSRAQWRAAMM